MRNLSFLFFIVFLHVSCSNENEENPIVFNLSSTIASFDCTAQSCNINVTTNVEWKIQNHTSLPEWLSVDKINENLIRIEVKENLNEDLRRSRVYFDIAKDSCFLDIVQDSKKYLAFKGKEEHLLSYRKDSLVVEIESNVLFNIKILENEDYWLSGLFDVNSPFLFGKTFIFSIKENTTQEQRKALVVITNDEYQLSDTLIIEQTPQIRLGVSDGDYKILNKSLKGNASLIVTGDGFTDKDLDDGHYVDCMDKAIDYFFSIEPYKTYRDYFNVYMVVAESEEEGVGEKNLLGGSSINNKFGTAFGSGTEIICDSELIFEYAHKVKELPENKPITVIVVLNSTKYAGTAYLYADGNSIALCPMSTEVPPNDFEGIVHHEAGGHAFGYLCDEYIYYERNIPESRKEGIREWQELGFQMNLDFTDNPNEVLWKDFIGIDKYDCIGIYEGGYEYKYGVWRSEENSCMNNNIPYYNAWSRWCIVNRIMQLSGLDFSISDFIDKDNVSIPNHSRSSDFVNPLPPLGKPVWVK